MGRDKKVSEYDCSVDVKDRTNLSENANLEEVRLTQGGKREKDVKRCECRRKKVGGFMI